MGRPAVSHSRRRLLRSSVGLAGLALISGCGFSPPWAPRAAQPPRIGFLARRDWPAARTEGFKLGLTGRGYVEGGTITVEWRLAERTEQLEEMAAELVALRVDLIVAASTLAIQAAMRATNSLPIVMAASGDPVG